MIDAIKKMKHTYIGISVAMLVIGLIIVIFPNITAAALAFLIGALVLVDGIVKLANYFSNPLYRFAFHLDLTQGVLEVLLGVLMLAHPGWLIELFPIVCGFFIIVDAATTIQTAEEARTFGVSSWWLMLLEALVSIIFGIVLLFRPMEGSSALMVLLGLAFVVCAVENLSVAIITSRHIKEFRNASDKDIIDE